MKRVRIWQVVALVILCVAWTVALAVLPVLLTYALHGPGGPP